MVVSTGRIMNNPDGFTYFPLLFFYTGRWARRIVESGLALELSPGSAR